MTRKINRIDRLARQEEKDIIKRILVLSVVSVVIIIVLFTVGTSFLGKIADSVNSISGRKNSQNGNENTFVQIPVIDTVPTATNSANLKLSGFSADGNSVDLFREEEKVATAKVQSGRFEFGNLVLKDGENDFRAKAMVENGSSSDFSQLVKVTLDKREPQLEVTSPSDGQNFSGDNNRIKVEGKVEKDAQVFASGFLANVDSSGKFDVFIPLVVGDNNVEVKAIDEAGNTKIVKLKLSYNK